jgi:hypothetical protein
MDNDRKQKVLQAIADFSKKTMQKQRKEPKKSGQKTFDKSNHFCKKLIFSLRVFVVRFYSEIVGKKAW